MLGMSDMAPPSSSALRRCKAGILSARARNRARTARMMQPARTRQPIEIERSTYETSEPSTDSHDRRHAAGRHGLRAGVGEGAPGALPAPSGMGEAEARFARGAGLHRLSRGEGQSAG